MHGPINVTSPNNTSKWQMGFNSAFKGLIYGDWKPATNLLPNILFKRDKYVYSESILVRVVKNP